MTRTAIEFCAESLGIAVVLGKGPGKDVGPRKIRIGAEIKIPLPSGIRAVVRIEDSFQRFFCRHTYRPRRKPGMNVGIIGRKIRAS